MIRILGGATAWAKAGVKGNHEAHVAGGHEVKRLRRWVEACTCKASECLAAEHGQMNINEKNKTLRSGGGATGEHRGSASGDSQCSTLPREYQLRGSLSVSDCLFCQR